MPAEVITPYQGGTVVTSAEAQAAAKASESFSAAFDYTPTTGGIFKNMDPVSQSRLAELRLQMRSNPPKPATVINLLPWPLMFPATNRFLRGIQVPACVPGKTYEWKHIRHWMPDWKYDEDGQQVFSAITPIQLAAEFIREFSDRDNDGGGVLIYLGESSPDKVGIVETYDSKGHIVTTDRSGFEFDQEEQKIPVTYKDPVTKDFKVQLKEAIAHRNATFMKRVQSADREYRKLLTSKADTGFRLTDKHYQMAEVLYAEGLIAQMPEWKLSTRVEQGLSEDNCKACGAALPTDGYRCVRCSNVTKPLEAYKDGVEVPEGKLALMSSDEWEEYEQIKAERESRSAPKPVKGKKSQVNE